MRIFSTGRVLVAAGILCFAALGLATNLHSRPACDRSSPVGTDNVADEAERAARHRIGQLLIVGFWGDDAEDACFRHLVASIKRDGIGGVLFLARNIKSREAVRAMVGEIKDASPVLPLITIDQEGGRVQRIKGFKDFPDTPAAIDMAAQAAPETAEDHYLRMAEALRDWGFNVNFGPVVDLLLDRSNPIIAGLGRAYSKDPDVVIAYAQAFVNAHRKAGLLTALKHFPGHGSTHADTHVEPVDVSRTWKPKELEPYKALVAEKLADAIMVGHMVLNRAPDHAYGADPATLSRDLIDRMIRQDLGFNGVLITDDIRMQALDPVGDTATRVEHALMAGNDLVIVSAKKEDPASFLDTLVDVLAERLQTSGEFRGRVDEAVDRVTCLRARLKPDAKPESAACGEQDQPSEETGDQT